MIKLKKRSLTLLEVMIALSLTAILLSVIFTSYRQTTISQAKLEKAKIEVLTNKTIEQRLTYIFSHLTSEKQHNNNKTEGESSPLYTLSLPTSKGVALILEYDNGIDPDPSFSHHIKSELYLSHKEELCLTTYSHTGLARREVLKEDISELKFSFFDPSAHQTHTSYWDFNQEDLPPIITLNLGIKNKKEPLEFAFFIPDSKEEILYQKKAE